MSPTGSEHLLTWSGRVWVKLATSVRKLHGNHRKLHGNPLGGHKHWSDCDYSEFHNVASCLISWCRCVLRRVQYPKCQQSRMFTSQQNRLIIMSWYRSSASNGRLV